MNPKFHLIAITMLVAAGGLGACAGYEDQDEQQSPMATKAGTIVGQIVALQLWQEIQRRERQNEQPVQQTDQIIVRYRGGDGPMTAAAAVQAARTLSTFTGQQLQHVSRTRVNGQVLALDKPKSVEDVGKLAKEIESMEGVQYAEPDIILQFNGMVPIMAVADSSQVVTQPSGTEIDHEDEDEDNDGHKVQRVDERLWHYYEEVGGINLAAVPEEITGRDVVIAVVDTGYRSHKDINPNLLLESAYDFIADEFYANDGDGPDSDPTDPGDKCLPLMPKNSFHGTHVTGIAAATINKKTGYRGVAPEAMVVPLRTLGKCGGYTSEIVAAIYYAAGALVPNGPDDVISNSAQAINLSLGAFGKCLQSLQDAIDYAGEQNIAVVVAAGNDNDSAHKYMPAGCNGVITVAATDRTGGRAWYSNTGSAVDIAAPGGNTLNNRANGILSTLVNDESEPARAIYSYKQGTSMATPLVAGVVALLYQVNPELTPNEILQILKETARAFPTGPADACRSADSTSSRGKICGAGIVDAAAAVNKARELLEHRE